MNKHNFMLSIIDRNLNPRYAVGCRKLNEDGLTCKDQAIHPRLWCAFCASKQDKQSIGDGQHGQDL